jgi:integrase
VLARTRPVRRWPAAVTRRLTRRSCAHSAARFLLAAGTHAKVVQEHLGHSSYAITADIYSHVGPAQQREAADRLDQALRW